MGLDAILEPWPEAPAVIAPELHLTRAELLAASRALAAHLADLGFRRGDRLAVWLPDGAGWLQCLFAAARLGLLVVPVSTRFTRAEAERVLRVAEPRGLVVPDAFLRFDYRGAGEALRGELPFLDHLILAPPHAPIPCAPGAAPEWGEPGDPLCTFSTSGTTGVPKLAPHDADSIARHAAAVARFFEIRPGDALMAALPLYGVLGFMQGVAALVAGAAWVSLPVWDPVACAGMMDAHRVTHFFGSDQIFEAVLEVPGASLRSWRIGGYADFLGWGARVADRAERRCGARLVGLYGSSEAFSLMAGRDWRAPLAERTPNGGRPVSPEIRFRVADPESGAVLPPGTPGELQLRGPNILPHYLNNPAATAAAFTADGWFRSGDLCLDEGNGAFLYLARLKDSLRLRGYLVDPGEIEAQLATHPAVAQAQVVGVRREGEGDVALGFVILREPAEEAALLAHCRAGLAAYKLPRRVLAVEAFPSVDGPNGVKILKHRLREMAEAALGEEA